MKPSLVHAITDYGTRYQQEELARYRPDELIGHWWLALDFFLNRASFQGRRDDISYRVYEQIRGVLAPEFTDDRDGHRYELHQEQQWEAIKTVLAQRIGKGMVGKARDATMVVSALQFISVIPDRNIVAYSVERIHRGEIAEHYRELQAYCNSQGIVQVGPKIASFYLRDVVALFKLGRFVAADASFYLHPVDVWVRKLLAKTGVVDQSADDTAIRRAIVSLCTEHGCSPVEFNQGAWYIGYHAFDLLLEILAETE
jgi:hypothetical protein